MLETNPLVTIGMPVYDGERYLEQALDSLLSQDFKNFKILISDNASTDRTQEICQKYEKSDSRIKYYRNDKNEGPSYNFNNVLQLAKSDYFMWASFDDIWNPKFISTLLTLLESNKTAVMAFPRIIIFDDTHPSIESHIHHKDYPVVSQLFSNNVYDRMYAFLQADDGKANLMYSLMRTDIIKKVDIYKMWGMTDYGVDILMIFRLLNFGGVISCNEILFSKRISEKKEDPALKSRIHRFIYNHFGKLDCFLAYIPIIKIADISTKEKIILSLLVFPRILKWMLSLIINTTSHMLKPQ